MKHGFQDSRIPKINRSKTGFSRLTHFLTTGAANTAVGLGCLNANISGASNTGIGTNADVTQTNLTNAKALGANTNVNASNKIRLGATTVTVIEGQVAYSFPSDGRFKSEVKQNVPGLDFVMRLKPVTYRFDTEKFNRHLTQDLTGKESEDLDYTESESIVHTGFILLNRKIQKAPRAADWCYVSARQNPLHFEGDFLFSGCRPSIWNRWSRCLGRYNGRKSIR